MHKSLPKLDRPKFEAAISVSDSGWVDTIFYDPKTQVLDAHLLSGQRYRYRDVGSLTFARVVTSKSVGKAFNKYIKPLPSKKLPRKNR